MTDPRVEELLDIEAIKQLKARYCLLLDAQEWDELRDTVFTADLRAKASAGDFDNAEDFVDSFRQRLTGESHVHHASMPIIELTGPDTAQGMWVFTNRGALGHYQEEYRREDGAWKISALEMTWIYAPSEELRSSRKGAFPEVAGQWRKLADRWRHRFERPATP
jgi:hypothetical protein